MTAAEKQVLVQDVIAGMEAWAPGGWIEYLFWEVLDERRKPPFWMTPYPEELFAKLTRLRDELEIWLRWSFETKGWTLVPIENWAEHAAGVSLQQAQDRALEKSRQREQVEAGPRL